jgi:hypothetical protein
VRNEATDSVSSMTPPGVERFSAHPLRRASAVQGVDRLLLPRRLPDRLLSAIQETGDDVRAVPPHGHGLGQDAPVVPADGAVRVGRDEHDPVEPKVGDSRLQRRREVRRNEHEVGEDDRDRSSGRAQNDRAHLERVALAVRRGLARAVSRAHDGKGRRQPHARGARRDRARDGERPAHHRRARRSAPAPVDEKQQVHDREDRGNAKDPPAQGLHRLKTAIWVGAPTSGSSSPIGSKRTP